MKKTVIILLAILPIVLVVVIAFAGRIFSIYRHVPVERVAFVGTDGEDLPDGYAFKVNVGQTKKCNVRIYPDLSSNKTVTYTSSDESICTVDGEGNITGVSLGTTTVMVKSFDGGKTDILTVRVTADNVTGVSLNMTQLEMTAGSTANLVATVTPYAALNKSVIFSSDNPGAVSVSPNGKLTAVSPGVAIITVTTVDGGYSATCTVTVSDDTPPIYFDLEGIDGITVGGVGYIVSVDTVNLIAYMSVADGIEPSEVKLEIVSGEDIASITDGVITFSGSGIVRIAAYTGDPASPENLIEIRMLHQ